MEKRNRQTDPQNKGIFAELFDNIWGIFDRSAQSDALVAGAKLACSKSPGVVSYLFVWEDREDINGLPAACVTDCKAGENILPFETCDGEPCRDKMDLADKWVNTGSQYEYIIDDEVITIDSHITCYKGGNITPIDSGQDRSGNPYIVTAEMLRDFGWLNVSADEVLKLNTTLLWYGITDMRSVALFMATCGHESGKGEITLEGLKNDGTTMGAYEPWERGAGYIQITWREAHLAFLKAMKDSYSGQDTAEYIAKNYPWEAAAWYWSTTDVKSMSGGLSLNEYVVKYGNSKDIYLITQYIVNSSDKDLDKQLARIRNGEVKWEIKNHKLYIDGKEIYNEPKNWEDREKNYNDAIKVFK